jgi:hypothetical protein
VYFHAEVVTYVARYAASQQEISKLITMGPPVMAQQTALPKDDEAAQFKQAVDSATADLRQSLQQEHDRAEALATELANARRAMEQKPAAVEEKPGVSFAWANSNAFVKPAQTAVQPDVAAETSKSVIKPGEPARVEHERGIRLPALPDLGAIALVDKRLAHLLAVRTNHGDALTTATANAPTHYFAKRRGCAAQSKNLGATVGNASALR